MGASGPGLGKSLFNQKRMNRPFVQTRERLMDARHPQSPRHQRFLQAGDKGLVFLSLDSVKELLRLGQDLLRRRVQIDPKGFLQPTAERGRKLLFEGSDDLERPTQEEPLERPLLKNGEGVIDDLFHEIMEVLFDMAINPFLFQAEPSPFPDPFGNIAPQFRRFGDLSHEDLQDAGLVPIHQKDTASFGLIQKIHEGTDIGNRIDDQQIF